MDANKFFLTKCPKCGKDVGIDAMICPHCKSFLLNDKNIVSKKNNFNKVVKTIPPQMIIIIVAIIIIIGEMLYNTFPETFNHINRVENVWCGYLYEKSSTSVLRIYKKDVDKKGSSICLKSSSLRGEEYFKLRQKSRTRLDDEPFESGKYKDKIVVITGKPYENKNSNNKKERYKILVESIKEWDGSKQPNY